MTRTLRRPSLAGIFGTILVWGLIFVLFSISAALFTPKKFKTIKIRLDSPAKIEKPKPVSPATQPKTEQTQTKNNLSTPQQNKQKTERQNKQTQEKIMPTKESPSKKTSEQKEIPLQKSMEELIAEQQAKKTTKKEFDWSQFDNMEGTTSSSKTSEPKKTPSSSQNALSGSAASFSEGASSANSSSSSSKKGSSQNASSTTISSLAQASSAQFYSSNGKATVNLSDGTPRILIEPKEPTITLSKEASNLISSTKKLVLSFTVNANGTVSVTSIKITPDILPPRVSMEIKEQISKWRFAAAETAGTARFDYTIQKN